MTSVCVRVRACPLNSDCRIVDGEQRVQMIVVLKGAVGLLKECTGCI